MDDFTLEDALERFDLLVSRGSGRDSCWVWRGTRNQGGYGSFHSTAGPSTRLAHRWHWIVRVGPLTNRLVLDHICRNRACVRLDHLRPVSVGMNTLAGESPAARNARKVVCSKGHELELAPGPSRRCPICRGESMRRTQQRRRMALAKAQQDAFAAEWARLPNLGGWRGPDATDQNAPTPVNSHRLPPFADAHGEGADAAPDEYF